MTDFSNHFVLTIDCKLRLKTDNLYVTIREKNIWCFFHFFVTLRKLTKIIGSQGRNNKICWSKTGCI